VIIEMTIWKYKKFEFEYPSKYTKDLLFVAVSGSYAYGWDREDSDIDFRYVWIEGLLQAVSIRNRGRTKHSKHDNMDITSYSLRNLLYLLAKGNGNLLENLYQEHLVEKTDMVNEIKKLTIANLHKGFLKHYLGYLSSVKKDMRVPSRLKEFGIQKLILTGYRLARAGIILAKHKKVIYNLLEQDKYHASYMYKSILADYLKAKESSEKDIREALEELDRLEAELKKYVDGVSWSPIFPSIVYDTFLTEYYKGRIVRQ